MDIIWTMSDLTDAQIIAHHAGLIAELRSESRALYASYVAVVGRLSHYESVEGCQTLRARHHAELARLGALEPPTPQPIAVGDFVCDICRSKISGPLGAACPFEHYPEGHAIPAMENP